RLRGQSAIRGAIQTITKTIQVAAGVFGPGHLGELTQQVPFELVDAVLAETLATQRRLRGLPSRVGGYFVLALGLFPGLGYQRVWAKLTAALPAEGPPSAKALRDLRRRVGPAPSLVRCSTGYCFHDPPESLRRRGTSRERMVSWSDRGAPAPTTS